MATNFVFIDSRLADYQTLVAGFAPGTEWQLINADENGVMQMARALAGRSGLQQEVAELVRTALETMGPRSLRDFLSETGLDAGDAAAAEAKWRAEVEAQLGLRGREIITTPAFKAWLQELLQEA